MKVSRLYFKRLLIKSPHKNDPVIEGVKMMADEQANLYVEQAVCQIRNALPILLVHPQQDLEIEKSY